MNECSKLVQKVTSTGPIAAWLVSGIGLCAVLVGVATVQVLRRRA
jgi:hypothetical protein